ncbi:MAG: M24 family metallopeptidase, partial [Chlorobi bacterium]|nr:M24 family metallopeptidase [Chlorobiota bacterium]
LAIHELPWIGPSSKQIIEPNMVFTIEPGVYLENGLGIRHEVMVLSHKIEGEVLGFAPIVEVV